MSSFRWRCKVVSVSILSAFAALNVEMLIMTLVGDRNVCKKRRRVGKVMVFVFYYGVYVFHCSYVV